MWLLSEEEPMSAAQFRPRWLKQTPTSRIFGIIDQVMAIIESDADNGSG